MSLVQAGVPTMNLTPKQKQRVVNVICLNALDGIMFMHLDEWEVIRANTQLLLDLSTAIQAWCGGSWTEDEARMAMLFLIEEAAS